MYLIIMYMSDKIEIEKELMDLEDDDKPKDVKKIKSLN